MQIQQLQQFPLNNQVSLSDHIIAPIKYEQVYEHATVKILRQQNLINFLANTIPHSRSEKQCKNIADLLKAEPYFASISKNFKMLLDISQWIEYKKVQQGEYIYKVGQNIDCFYILIKGEVHQTVTEKIVQEEPPKNSDNQQDLRSTCNIPLSTPELSHKKTSYQERSKQMVKKIRLFKKLSVMEPIKQDTPQKPKIQVQEKMVRLVNPGQSFGDVSHTPKRGTHAKAKQLSHLLVIKKQYFQNISQGQLKSQGKKRYEFLSSLSFFKLLNRYSIEAIVYCMEELKVNYNQVVYEEDDDANYINVVYKGEFKLFKKIGSKKQQTWRQGQIDIQSSYSTPKKKICFKSVGPGQMLCLLEIYQTEQKCMESCVCKSQEGVILRFHKTKFLKKVMNTDNNMEEIKEFVRKKAIAKKKEIQSFIEKQQNDHMYIRYLHTPSTRLRTCRTQSSQQRQVSQKKQNLRRLSTSSNFFSEMNKNVHAQSKVRRISINRSLRHADYPIEPVPNGIKDIVELVAHENKYHNMRRSEKEITLFDFSISKVPLHIRKKYEFLYKKCKK